MFMQPWLRESITPSVTAAVFVSVPRARPVTVSWLAVPAVRVANVPQALGREVEAKAVRPVVPQVGAFVSIIEKSLRPAVEVQEVVVSTNEPPFAARVLAVTEVGTPTTDAVTDSPALSPIAADVEFVSFVVTSIFTRAAPVAVSPTTVNEVSPLGPTEAAKPVTTADAGETVTTDKRPKLKAETATSAMRLRVVFVDICFLSLVVKKTFFFTAGKERLFAS